MTIQKAIQRKCPAAFRTCSVLAALGIRRTPRRRKFIEEKEILIFLEIKGRFAWQFVQIEPAKREREWER